MSCASEDVANRPSRIFHFASMMMGMIGSLSVEGAYKKMSIGFVWLLNRVSGFVVSRYTILCPGTKVVFNHKRLCYVQRTTNRHTRDNLESICLRSPLYPLWMCTRTGAQRGLASLGECISKKSTAPGTRAQSSISNYLYIQ